MEKPEEIVNLTATLATLNAKHQNLEGILIKLTKRVAWLEHKFAINDAMNVGSRDGVIRKF